MRWQASVKLENLTTHEMRPPLYGHHFTTTNLGQYHKLCPSVALTDLLALVADIVGIFPHGVLQGLLVELGSGGHQGLAVHLVLVLQAHQTLPLHILMELIHRPQHVSKLRVANGSVLGGQW